MKGDLKKRFLDILFEQDPEDEEYSEPKQIKEEKKETVKEIKTVPSAREVLYQDKKLGIAFQCLRCAQFVLEGTYIGDPRPPLYACFCQDDNYHYIGIGTYQFYSYKLDIYPFIFPRQAV